MDSLPPIRCFTCGKVTCIFHYSFRKRIRDGEIPKDVLDSFNLTKICCRRMVMSAVSNLNVTEDVSKSRVSSEADPKSDQTNP